MYENPVLIKEIKTKMRSRHPKAVQATTAALILLFILWCYYQAIGWMVRWGGPNAGKDGWQAAVAIQALLIWALSPAMAANAITQEKEQQTWEMLVFTRLTPSEILLGKLLARLLPMAAILGAFFPFMLFCYADSRTLTPLDFFNVYLNFAVWTLFMVTVSLFMSWAFRKTAAAIATAYLVLFLLTIGTALIHTTITYAQSNYTETAVLWLNPVIIAGTLIDPSNNPNAAWILTFSLLTFSGIAAFLFWRMVARFRAFSTE
jgi:ABC-type transport system involved in multi-copper enzyme maturation permease subunit